MPRRPCIQPTTRFKEARAKTTTPIAIRDGTACSTRSRVGPEVSSASSALLVASSPNAVSTAAARLQAMVSAVSRRLVSHDRRRLCATRRGSLRTMAK
jgi:hypothetical protein